MQNIVQIKPLDQTIHCMTYVPWKLNGMPDDCILFGDDQGKHTQFNKSQVM